MAGVAVSLTFGRYIIRYRKLGRFFWDDAIHGLALIFLLAMIVAYTVDFPQMYLVDSFKRGDSKQAPISKSYKKKQLMISILFWLCVYAVKSAFLVLYRAIFGVTQIFNRAWWITVAFTFLTFWICIIGELTTCGKAQDLFNQGDLTSLFSRNGIES